jgi:hypothetical protein
MRLLVVAAAVLTLLLAAEPSSAVERIQQSGMFDGPVNAISEPDADGNRYLGGSFTRFNPWNTGASAVVDGATGAVDASFPKVGPAGAIVFAAEADGSGGFFIAGAFGEVDGQARNGLARILADGSVDPAWTAGLETGTFTSIRDMQLVGGVLYVVGEFSTVATAPGGTTTVRRGAAAFNATTGAVTAWNPAAEGSRTITSIAVDASAGRAYLGGNFMCLNARVAGSCSTDTGKVTRWGLAAVDLVNGDAVLAFDAAMTGGNFGVIVEALVLSATGDWLYLGGEFQTVNGQPRERAAAIRTNGTNAVGAWAPDPNNRVLSLAISGSSLYMGGTFTTVADGGTRVDRQYLAAVSLDPSAAAVPTPLSVSFSIDTAVRRVSLQGTDLYVSGSFSAVDGSPQYGVAKFSLAGALQGWDPGVSLQNGGTVFTVLPLGSDVLLGGLFSQVGGEERTYAAAVDVDGYLTDWSVELDGEVNAVVTQAGKVFVGGTFSQANGTLRNLAAAFDTSGVLDPNWDPDLGPRPSGAVYALTAVGSTIYIGGDFAETATTSGSPIVRTNAAAFSTSGALDTAWTPEPDARVYALTSLGSTVYLGGEFGGVQGGTSPNYAAAFTTSGALVAGWDPDPDSDVYALTALGSTVYVGGEFEYVLNSSASSVARNGLAAFTATGTLVSGWDPALDNPGVYGLAASGSTIYVGGDFAQAGAATRLNAAAVGVDGALQAWAPDPNGRVNAVAADTGAGMTYLAGSFRSVNGAIARSYSAAASAGGAILDPWPRLGPPTLYALSVAKQGTGAGTVTSSPAGIDCGATCASSIRAGRTVTLTAAAAAGSTFAGWGGACSGTAATCAVTMDQARSVTAQFDAQVTPPDPDPRTSSLRVVSAKPQARGQAVVIRLRVSGAGRVAVVGTVAGAGARSGRTRVCAVSRTVRSAGAVRIECRLNAVGRALLARRALTVRLAISYAPTDGGETVRAVRSVRLQRFAPSPAPVTG